MTKRCVCYVTDRGYVFPSLLSARQAKRMLTLPDADVIVLLTEDLGADGRAVADFCRREGVVLLDLAAYFSDAFSALDAKRRDAFAGKITVSAMGRLLLAEVLPEAYSEILYIDGDTQIVDSLDSLLRAEVPKGMFLAARDYIGILEVLRSSTEHMPPQSLDAEAIKRLRYFNSGVLRFKRDGWIGREAFEFFVKHPEKCQHHDQSALNAVANNSFRLISNRWNFPKQFLHLNRNGAYKPAIIHYMGHPKPWHGAYLPWGHKEHAVYLKLLADYPGLLPLYSGLKPFYRLAYFAKTAKTYADDCVRQYWERFDVAPLFVGDYEA